MPADRMFDLYWLGYLLTEDRERSVDAVIETLQMPDRANPCFEAWMVKWSRKIFIAKVLGGVTHKTSARELRIRLRRLQSGTERSSSRRPVTAGSKGELEAALLRIEPLPRRALLLNVFEKLAIEDIGILLNLDRESVKTATAIGLIELTRNLAGDWQPATCSAKHASFGALWEMTV
jgi:hypothetical protein